MRILKFGGSSLADDDGRRHAARIAATVANRKPCVIVVSALGGVTDRLVAMRELASAGSCGWRGDWIRLAARHREAAALDLTAAAAVERRLAELVRLLDGITRLAACPAETGDRVLAAGERLAAETTAAHLRRSGLRPSVIDGAELVATDARHGAARVDPDRTRARCDLLRATVGTGAPAVVPGFVGSTDRGVTTTLGRGGSHLSATVIAEAVDAHRVEIYTDVPGVMSAPPRLAPWARTVDRLTLDEARLLAWSGAEVLHEDSLEPATRSGIELEVRSTWQPAGPATRIGRDPVTPRRGLAVAVVEDASLITIVAPRASLVGALAVLGEPPPIALSVEPGVGSVVAAGRTDWADEAERRLAASGHRVTRSEGPLATVLDLDARSDRLDRAVAHLETVGARMLGSVTEGAIGVRALVRRERLDSTLSALAATSDRPPAAVAGG